MFLNLSTARRFGLFAASALVLCACGGGSGPAAEASQASPPAQPAQPASSPVSTASADLAWSAGVEPDLRGYRIYFGTNPGQYVQAQGAGIDVGKVVSYNIAGLERGKTYYISMTAYDDSNNESGYSAEVIKVISP